MANPENVAPPNPSVQCADRAAWRAWLQAHHADDSEVWLAFYKKHTGKAPGYRRQYLAWITSAKRPETKQKRLQKAIVMLAENRKPGM